MLEVTTTEITIQVAVLAESMAPEMILLLTC